MLLIFIAVWIAVELRDAVKRAVAARRADDESQG
jgi:hypothetical protein